MKKIVSILITLCLTVSLVAGLAVSSSAAAVSGEKRTLPRVRTAPVMDGVRDDLYDQGFTETLNFENAGFRVSSYEDDETGEPAPLYEPASANISAVWYSNLPEDTEIIGIWDTVDDTEGGLYIFAEVTDCSRAWGVNNTSVVTSAYLADPSSYPYATATPEFEISDSFWVLLDPANYKSGTGKGLSGFAFTPYCGAATGCGNVVYPVPSWREYFNWAQDMSDSGAGGTLSSYITVDVKSTVQYVEDENHPFPEPLAEGADSLAIFKYRKSLSEAYQYSNISGYTLEMFLSWSATQMDVDDPSADVNDFLYPVVGTEFGMGFQLYDNLFDYPIGTMPPFDEVQYQIFLNCGLLDFGEGEVEYWSDATYPIYYPRYILGDYADNPTEDIICGDANGDGVVDIADAMLVFYHVAKKELLQDDQLAVCDTNGDGEVDIADAMKIFYFVAKKVSSVKDPEITESEAADFVSALNTTYRIANANMPIFSNSNPGDPVFFPMKDDNGASYLIPDYLYYYYVVYNEVQTSQRPVVNLNNYPDTPASELLTTAEADWIKNNSDELYFHAIEISELQGIFDSIYGKDAYKLGGTIESGYTESGYYLLPGFPGWDAGPSCKSTSVGSVEVSGNKARVSVDETWSVPLWVDGEPIPGDTVILKTVYTVEKTDSGLRLTDALTIIK